ncbi:protein-disulfide reductase DsbD [Mesorhizobium sp. A556]
MRALLAILVFVGCCTAALAEPLPANEAFRLQVSGAPDGTVQLDWTIADGYYLYRDHIKAKGANGQDVKVETPTGTQQDDPNFGPMEVYYGRAAASVVAQNAGTVELVYQGCQVDGICYRPETRIIDAATLAVSDPYADGGAPMLQWAVEDAAAPPPAPTENDESSSTPPAFNIAQEQGLVPSLLERGGATLVIASFLLFGLALAFTPCVFPMYPILAATLAREGDRLTPRRGFLLSAIYVVFLAIAFALLGAVAGWSGQNLQMALQSPITAGVVAVIFAVLALSMFGLFELQLPSAWTNAIVARTGGGGGSKRSAAVLGFSSALIVGPCVTAPLAGALLYIGQSANVALGAAALFALGIGKGIPLIVLATMGGGALPRAGAWMENAKRLFGFGFLGSAIWMATPLMPAGLDLALWAALLIGVASFFFSAEWAGARVTARALGATSLIYGVILMVGAASGGTNPLKPLAAFTGGSTAAGSALVFSDTNSTRDLQGKLDNSKGTKPTLVYFTADWCVTCRSIERSVLTDTTVRAGLGDFTLIKADLSYLTKQNAELMQELDVAGPPTMVFFDRASREAAGTRLIGDVTVQNLTRSAAITGDI